MNIKNNKGTSTDPLRTPECIFCDNTLPADPYYLNQPTKLLLAIRIV